MGDTSSRTSNRTYDVLFLVKNDSGLGHIRRAVLLSKELRRLGVSSVVFSQASSIVLFNDPDLRVVNFPLIERLKSSAAEQAYGALLDALAEQLDPKLVVEDTYPDHRYLSVPSLRGIPRLLVLRRLDPVSFDHVRRQGGFSRYDRVVVAQEQSDFAAEPHTQATRRLVTSSGRFVFCGPVFHEPDADELVEVDKAYNLGEQPLVVVTAGSGGDQLNDAYAERLFRNAARVAGHCDAQDLSARFVLVVGPYYRGRPLSPARNVEVVSVEPRLAALMHRAAVVVMRPGHNVLHEALTGSAELVLVPGIPWMEGQPEFARRMADRVGAAVVDIDDYDLLESCIVERLSRHDRPASRPGPVNGTAVAAAAIAAEVGAVADGPTAEGRQRLIAIQPPERMNDRDAADAVGTVVSPAVPIIGQGSGVGDRPLRHRKLTRLSALLHRHDDRASEGGAVYVDVEIPARITPAELASEGHSMVLYPDEGDVGVRMRHWLTFTGSSRAALVDAALDRIVASPRRTRRLGWVLASSSRSARSRGLLLDCSGLGDEEFCTYLVELRCWLDRLQIEPQSLDQFARERVFSLYGSCGHGDVEEAR